MQSGGDQETPDGGIRGHGFQGESSRDSHEQVQAVITTGGTGISRRDGTYEVEASGLPGNKEVRIALRRGDSLTVLDTVETDTAGKLSVEIEVPAKTVEAGGDAVIVVETADERVRLVSDVLALD